MIKIKIAVLSDIHGNNVALEAVLEDARKNNVDEYIVAGDLITDFSQSNEVIENIKKLTPYVIKGNREDYILKYDKTKDLEMWNSMQYSNIVNFYKGMSKENIEYIKKLPETLSINFNDLRIKVMHRSPYSLYKDKHIENKEQVRSMIFNDLEEDMLVYGHVHEEVKYVKKDNKILLHSGVVGMHNNTTNNPEYAIIEYNQNKEISVTKRIVKYDKDLLKETLLKSDILKTNRIWTNLCYYCIKTGQDLRNKFLQEAMVMMNEKYKGKKQDGIDSNFEVIDDDIFLDLSKKYEKYFLL